MAKIIVNDNFIVNGHISLTREKVEVEQDGEKLYVVKYNGVFSTHLYIEDINTLEMQRMKMENVDIYREDFGSDDYNMTYHFTCTSVTMNGVEEEGIYFIIDGEEMERIENIMYEKEHDVLGDIGKEYLKGGE